ncbi:MAG: hypothetical protein ACI4MN_05815 [Candidatus Coproplasma sp.]
MYEQENDFLKHLTNLGFGWTNSYYYEDAKNALCSMREWAYQQKTALKNLYSIDVADVYQQLDGFESLVDTCNAACRREAIIVTALAYAEHGQPIISSDFNQTCAPILTSEEKRKNAERYRFDVISDLLNYYLENYKNLTYYNAIQAVFPEFIELEKVMCEGAYQSVFVLKYLKILLYYKDLDGARKVFEQYPITPHNKKETADYERIKSKIFIYNN